VPAARPREVDHAVAETAWGGYRTEFRTYDDKAIVQQQRDSAK
jgi:hypothetical protein